MKNKLATLVGALALSAAASAQTWIWYPGDYEIWLGNRMNNVRNAVLFSLPSGKRTAIMW